MNIVPCKAPSAVGAWLAALLIPCLLLSACGGGGSSSSSAAPAPTGRTVTGLAQKGPFRQGATVSAQPLSSTGDNMGAPITATIRSDRGDYTLTIPAGRVPTGGSVLLEVTGMFLDEWTGELVQGTLQSIVPFDANTNTWNINLLTHLVAGDVMDNLRTMQASEALRLAEQDLLTRLQIVPSKQTTFSFHQLDLLDDDENNVDSSSLQLLTFLFSAYADDQTGMTPTAVLNALQDDAAPLETFHQNLNCTTVASMLVDAAYRLVLDQILADDTLLAALRLALPTMTIPDGFDLGSREALLTALKNDPELTDVEVAEQEIRDFCEMVVSPDTSPRANYRVHFQGQWTEMNQPGGVPAAGTHFTTFIGATHSSVVHLWNPGEKASPGIESVAEDGRTETHRSEIADFKAAGSVGDAVSFGLSSGSAGTASGMTTFNITRMHPLLSLASMLAPTPDWFVGLNSVSLLDPNGNWKQSERLELFAYDAGTESGTEFTRSEPPNTVTDQPIARLSERHGNIPLGMAMKPLGIITLTRQP